MPRRGKAPQHTLPKEARSHPNIDMCGIGDRTAVVAPFFDVFRTRETREQLLAKGRFVEAETTVDSAEQGANVKCSNACAWVGITWISWLSREHCASALQ